MYKLCQSYRTQQVFDEVYQSCWCGEKWLVIKWTEQCVEIKSIRIWVLGVLRMDYLTQFKDLALGLGLSRMELLGMH